VHIALCNDQFSRWAMEGLCRDAMLFLAASRPLDLRQWPNYTPKRGQQNQAFPVDRMVVYSLALQLPAHVGPSLALLAQRQQQHTQQQQQQQQQQRKQRDEGDAHTLACATLLEAW
jgi:hypothetical protein